jgi:hypothetical protein
MPTVQIVVMHKMKEWGMRSPLFYYGQHVACVERCRRGKLRKCDVDVLCLWNNVD